MRTLNWVDLQPWHTLQSPAIGRELCLLESRKALYGLEEEDLILGGGSNVICMGEVKRRLVKWHYSAIALDREQGNQVYVRASGGTNWQKLVEFCCEQDFYGLENLAGIYGTVGAAPVQNIGAYGVEVASAISQLEVFDRRERRFFWLRAPECKFSYRHSIFKENPHWLIVTVEFVLQKQGELQRDYGDLAYSAATTPAQFMHEILARRAERLPAPEQEPNAGSFFHNVVVTPSQLAELHKREPDMPYFLQNGRGKIPSGWLIERCGFRGLRLGKVGMSAKHALVLTNQGGSGEEILAFAHEVQRDVKERFGLTLTIEPTVLQ